MKLIRKNAVLKVIFYCFFFQLTYPMGLLMKYAPKNGSQSYFTKKNYPTSLHKNDKKSIHIFSSKKSNTLLTKEAHNDAYKASLQHEYPTAPFYNKNYDPIQCETDAIKKTLAEKQADIDVIWIPRTLYELFVIMIHGKNEKVPVNGYKDNLEKDDLKKLLDSNNDEKNILYHKKINDFIVDFLHTYPNKQSKEDKEYFIELAEKLLTDLSYKIQDLKDLILNAITYETEMYKKNPDTFLLYRGGELENRDFSTVANYALNDTPEEHEHLPKYVSLSFGLGFFAAYFTDPGACTAWLSSKKAHPEAYALPIEKKEVLENKSPFFVPPLTPLSNFFSKGEGFHARTKMPILSSEKKIFTIKPQGWHATNNAPFPKILTTEINQPKLSFAKQKGKTLFYKDLYKTIITKAIPLNNPTEKIIQKVKNCLPEE